MEGAETGAASSRSRLHGRTEETKRRFLTLGKKDFTSIRHFGHRYLPGRRGTRGRSSHSRTVLIYHGGTGASF